MASSTVLVCTPVKTTRIGIPIGPRNHFGMDRLWRLVVYTPVSTKICRPSPSTPFVMSIPRVWPFSISAMLIALYAKPNAPNPQTRQSLPSPPSKKARSKEENNGPWPCKHRHPLTEEKMPQRKEEKKLRPNPESGSDAASQPLLTCQPVAEHVVQLLSFSR